MKSKRGSAKHKRRARVGRIALGVGLVVVGIIDLPLPGPGIVIIAAGLLVLSRDWPPAQRLVDWCCKRWPKIGKKVAHLRARGGG